jgi:hypothetical protein
MVYNSIEIRRKDSEYMSKLNQLLLEWKAGDVHGLRWLSERAIGQRLAYSYFEDGYLEKLGPGVFKRKGDDVNPFGLVRFLQGELNLKLHVSARSALELHGHSHYVPLGKKEVLFLTSFECKSIPKWIIDLNKNFEMIFKKSSLLAEERFLTDLEKDGFPVRVSCRELAILELIDTLDLSGGLEIAENYTESLRTLRYDVLQKVLEQCKSVKVKRVFLFLAEKTNLPSFNKLKLKKIDVGSGKRVIVKDGEFNKRYQITVDRSYGENPF